VDGFRLDVFNAYFKDAEYQNNPPAPGLIPFDAQKHIHDIDQPEMMPLLKVMRDLLDLYPGSFSVGETFLSTSEKTISYIGPNKLHTAFSFDFTSSRLIVPVFPWNPGWLSRRIIRRERVFNRAGAWPATVFSNHDLPRAASRYARTSGDEQAFLEIALLLTLPGTPFLYYGEEIGMRDIHLKKNEIMDPAGKPYWLFYKGRDGCRAPMQWDATPNAGFTSATPWLPVNPDYLVRNVTTQLKNPASLLSFCKKLIALRRASPALRRGAFHPWLSKHGVLSFLRITEEQTILVVMNFSSRWRKFAIPNGRWEPLLSNGRGSPTLLEPFEIQVLIRNA
jgi:alpha-glucosidase